MLLWHYGRVVRDVDWPRPVCLFCAAASHAVALRSPYCVCMHAHSQTHPHTHTPKHTHWHTRTGRLRHAGSSIDVAILMAMFHAPLSAKFNARRKYAVSPAPPWPSTPPATPTAQSLRGNSCCSQLDSSGAAPLSTLLQRGADNKRDFSFGHLIKCSTAAISEWAWAGWAWHDGRLKLLLDLWRHYMT